MHPQDVTLKPGHYAIFLVYALNRPDVSDPIKQICGELKAIVRSLRGRFPGCEASCVVGFGATAYAHLFPQVKKPKELVPFAEIKGEKHTAPSTPGDLFFHIRAKQMAYAYEIASAISFGLGDSAYVLDEVHGFRYLDGRAILGFVDGTENPEYEADALNFAVIGDNEPDFRGGSYAFVQKYTHNMVAWGDLTTFEQEEAIGRRKYDDRELPEGVKPDNAHNAVTNISGPTGEELKIVRANMPFFNTSQGEHGTYFIGYASTFTTTRKMLENMFLGDPPGNTDRLLDFSTAVTGTLFFIPSVEFLEELCAS
ncbi:MAG: Dyp-type peroxidase [Deltaproteobacteria bacterium]|jgi:putative iron-dependent peroxidase|nr:Dyp-type peroxidase [Deltaproteobacteria bacterium]